MWWSLSLMMRRRDGSMKRDEWSKEAVSCLLEAYEAKWSLRNRAKLRGRDWHDIATFVSAKTHNQCKNKIESMKKRYRSELATAHASSSWPLFRRIDRLLRGGNMTLPASPPPQSADSPPRLAKGGGKNAVNDVKSSEQEESNKSGSNERESRNGKRKIMMNGRKGESMVMRWVAEVMVKKEEELMETMREIERIRMEAEEKRDEFQLKQTQIIANVHLQIAALYAKSDHHS